MFDIRKARRWVGALLSIACVFWVLYRFARSGVVTKLMHASMTGQLAWGIAAAIPVYTVGVAMLGIAWWWLQRAYSSHRIGFVDTWICYVITQFGKYLPGNVAQYVGRHVILKRWGLSHPVLVACTLTEAALLVGSALIWGGGMLDRFVPWLPAWLPAALALATPAIAMALLWMMRSHVPRFEPYVSNLAPMRLLPAAALYLAFFGLMAMTLMLISAPFEQGRGTLTMLPAVAALSWVAGYLVIGAPAGIGVREAVFLALLQGRLAETDILLLVAGFRVATFGGDLLAFLAGLPFGARLKSARTDNAATH